MLLKFLQYFNYFSIQYFYINIFAYLFNNNNNYYIFLNYFLYFFSILLEKKFKILIKNPINIFIFLLR